MSSVTTVPSVSAFEMMLSICDHPGFSPEEKVNRLVACLPGALLTCALMKAYKRNYGECAISKFPDRVHFENFEFIAKKNYSENITEWYNSTMEWKRQVADLRELIATNC